MPLRTFAELSTRVDEGRSHTATLYKPTVAAAQAAGNWVDASVSGGIPVYNAYAGAPLEATPLVGGGNRGINTGPFAGPKRLLTNLLQTRTAVAPACGLLLDYLMFYPLVDLDSTDEQTMTQAATLPRYASGEGVRIMPVFTLGSTAPTDCTVAYTNSAGAPKSITFSLTPGSSPGSIGATSGTSAATTANNPFVPLAEGDTGVRSIQGVTLSTAVGGFCCFVLVKPLTSIVVPEQNTCSEDTRGMGRAAVQILPGAYLNFALKLQGTPAVSSWLGQLTFVED